MCSSDLKKSFIYSLRVDNNFNRINRGKIKTARVRKELTSQTALAIMGSQLAADSQAMRVPDSLPADPAPLEGGRVKVSP